ncbi:putative 18S rRNA (guanine-N(7))-methyltransferase [Zancudomyces culisetae]|uniref:Putative 18S rRNA (Guanine-N(7))-methyltransferase n=1 Tax=Zancudomyces culisetae TaxID=1213189 RepID=A0A1R1PH56_ZANCU|nr:putative 18S rRNA (guanine-N(7))-methyltransferase [Zancudomyces culisetae]OMH80259.1 putative 18S rRNA (guanine-N(7))-methyltransferase [Zancudomyces culisetae]|eukprot:OMH80056.1 putative 18S rRNA (guanine-N(7))-methyltransferase [Zancudomyces culisetae]
MESATVCGFTGGVVIDYPNSKKAKKYYLCLFAGSSGGHNGKANGAASHQQLPQGLTGEHENTVENSNSNSRFNGFSKGKKGKRVSVKSKDWILHKKDIQRKKGEKPVPRDSKYTGRKRRTAF